MIEKTIRLTCQGAPPQGVFLALAISVYGRTLISSGKFVGSHFSEERKLNTLGFTFLSFLWVRVHHSHTTLLLAEHNNLHKANREKKTCKDSIVQFATGAYALYMHGTSRRDYFRGPWTRKVPPLLRSRGERSGERRNARWSSYIHIFFLFMTVIFFPPVGLDWTLVK